MWKELLGQVLGTTKVQQLDVKTLPGEKPDYTPAIIGVISLIIIVVVFYIFTKKAK